jgi:hypothetical protein
MCHLPFIPVNNLFYIKPIVIPCIFLQLKCPYDTENQKKKFKTTNWDIRNLNGKGKNWNAVTYANFS